MKGITEHHRREVGVNLTAGRVNSVEIGQKILGMPEMDELLARFQKEHNLPSVELDPRYTLYVEPELVRREEPETVDDSVMEMED